VVKVLVGTSRCDVTGGKAAGILRPLGARTVQRAVPASEIRRTIFKTSSVQLRSLTEMSFNGLTRRNIYRTSSGEAINYTLTP